MKTLKEIQDSEFKIYKDLCTQTDPSAFSMGWHAALAWILDKDIRRD